VPAFFARRVGDRAVIEGRDARHLARSLRARRGEDIEVIDPQGFLLTVRIDAVAPDRIEGRVVTERVHQPEPAARITIAIARQPASALEQVFSRCTEAGAHAFTVFSADRSVGRGEKVERWNTICREAAMLAGRLHVPAVTTAPSLAAAIAAAANPVLLVRDSPQPLAGLTAPADLTLIVGPEGGWSARERELAPITASLGPRNLRADTAALVGLAVALAARG
jgi:16S rRNA (uracil1498-N3)-methyltransferase